MGRTKGMVLCSLFAALIAVLAQVSIPLPFGPVPLTGQTFAVLLAGAVLGHRWGTLSVFVYILMGAVGLPVFSYFQGGAHILVGPTGGYLWGFIPGCFLLGVLTEKKFTYGRVLVGMFVCAAVYFTVGTIYLAWLLKLGFYPALLAGVLPFLPLDIVKIFAAGSMSVLIRRRIRTDTMYKA